MAEIRRFFADRGVLEVETPCMSQATVTDIHLVPFETRFVGPGHSQGMNLWLMTSPEYHMKRLLVAGCGPVFQLCRSFRGLNAAPPAVCPCALGISGTDKLITNFIWTFLLHFNFPP